MAKESELSARRRAALLEVMRQYADPEGRVRADLDTLRTRISPPTSRHDAIKSIVEMKTLGLLDYAMVRGDSNRPGPERIRLLQRSARNGAAGIGRLGDVMTYLQDHGGGTGEWVPVQLKALAEELGTGYSNLSMVVRRAAKAGKLQTRIAETRGTPIEALRVPTWVPRAPEAPGAPVPVSPLLDAYRAARDFAAANPGNPFISFEPIPIAEEALAVIDG